MTKINWLVAIILLLLGLIGGYFYGNSRGFNQGRQQGYTEGYIKAQLDLRASAAEASGEGGLNPTAETVAPNPFQAKNPLEGVSFNPLKDVKDKLNPFAQ